MDEFPLEEISELHAVSTEWFVPFVIYRLGASGQTEARFQVELRQVDGIRAESRLLRIHWREESIPSLPAPVSDETVTEWAALGIASIVVWKYAGAQLSSVTIRGDRFDYWILRNGERIGLEVSGTTADRLSDRHREKVAQLTDNPFATAGLVVVVGFASRRVILSYHSSPGAQS